MYTFSRQYFLTAILISLQEEGKMFKKTGSKVVDLKSASAAEVNMILSKSIII